MGPASERTSVQIKGGKHAVKWTRLSCTTFRGNAARLQLDALGYNLANFLLGPLCGTAAGS
jgi:hypothetical protein